jgi:tetratricopeptide (TPR) repeat protein
MYMEKEKAEEALADLTKAVEAEPRDLQSLLMRAQVHLQKDDFDKAEEDIEDILALQPNSPGALYFRSLIAANQKRMDEAIDDLQKLVRIVPDNIQFLLQLASFYQMDDRPNKAIELADEILKANKPEWKELTHRVYRLRGDARLSIGKHVEAIADFEKAIELVPAEEKESRSGLLNNLAWVLATSPKDEIRNGKRSVELGTEACELTEFKEAHILSTLAAGYAEIGNFEEAIKWSTKAVELGSQEKAEQLDQLRKELESYQQNKPWREQQDVQEKKAPIVPSADGVDT